MHVLRNFPLVSVKNHGVSEANSASIMPCSPDGKCPKICINLIFNRVGTWESLRNTVRCNRFNSLPPKNVSRYAFGPEICSVGLLQLLVSLCNVRSVVKDFSYQFRLHLSVWLLFLYTLCFVYIPATS